MGVRFRVDPIDRAAKVLLTGLEEQRAAMAAQFAREEIARAEAINTAATGSEVKYIVAVDGRVGAPLESVNTNGGSILVEFALGADVLRWIADRLKQRSPSRTGRYIGAQIMLADGAEASPYGRIPPADLYTFLDTTPYAQKIEVGRTKSGRSFVIQASNSQVYERTRDEAARRFGQFADIKFGWTTLTTAYRLQKAEAKRKGGGSRAKGSALATPAIFVKMKGF